MQRFDTTVRKTVASYTYQRSVHEVHQEFDQLDPQSIGEACRAWKRAADELLALADGLKSQAAAPLSAAWTSPASPAAQQQLQQAEATARALANDCMQMAHATDYAAQYAQWYKDNLPSYTDSLATAAKGVVTGHGLTAGADAATQHLVNLLSRYNEVIQTLPPSVRAGLVGSDNDGFTPTTGGTGETGGGLPAGSLGGSTTTAPGLGGGRVSGSGSSTGGHLSDLPGTGAAPSAGIGSGSSVPGAGIGAGTSGSGSADPYAAGSSLAGTGLGGSLSGFDPNALGSGASGASGAGASGGLGAGLGAGALGATGLGAGGLAGGLGSGRAGSGLAGAGGAGTLGAQGTGGSAAGLSAEGAAASGAGRGTGMMPMHGAGGHGEGEEERDRSTWLTEDDDVWGSGGDVPPPVITN